jgi:excisionase family DNA binding protein
MEPIALTIPQACAAASTGRTVLYREISDGRLRAIKRGRRTLILRSDLHRWLESLPEMREAHA